ncbi:MAG TPA: DUF1127 domain-containing protein [Acetobacteraceae bacterium]|nr:DUF1127 domain-containing protein [Acetobacteraceae bacterium]
MDAPYDTTTGYPHTITMAGTGFGRIGRWLSERRRIGRTMAELQRYTDRELADMGLARSDIPLVARGLLQRD